LRKLQSFFIFKFESDRLREVNYTLNITLDQARKNNEVVRLGDSELLRAIRRIKGITFEPEKLKELEQEKHKISTYQNTFENRHSLEEIDKLLDSILFVPEIFTVTFKDSRHYKKIIEQGGLTINNKKYVRLLAGSGMTRRSTVMFCQEDIYEELDSFLQNNYDKNYQINPSKYNAYYALAGSATLDISVPYFIIIPDCEIERITKVDYMQEVDDKTDPIVSPKSMNVTFNLFDGQGLISPSYAEQWSHELELDYTPSAFVIRGAFLKGLLVTFDFQKLARTYSVKNITDIYGNIYDIRDIDVIISASQFKMWNAYSSIEEYKGKCQQNKFGWGITRVSPKVDKDFTFTTYQYIQNLNITTQEEIKNLCKKTVNWLSSVMGMDWKSTVLYLLGDIQENTIDEKWFNRLSDNLLKAIMIEPRILEDPYAKQHIARMINKKIHESYQGILLLDGNYQFMIADPYAQAQHAFGFEPKGLLAKDEHYSNYWNERKTQKVSAVRSPMTWRSENNILYLQNNSLLKTWYSHIYSGIIFNVHGTDFMSMSGADVDGDICMTTNQPEFVNGNYPEILPPAYNRQISEKKIINQKELWEFDAKTFKSKIGLTTNIGTNFFAMLSEFEPESDEYKAIINRIKICNCLQSMEIDRAKGIKTMSLPKWWTSWTKITEDMTPEEKERANFYNKIVCKKRPYFFKYLYSDNYGRKYNRHLENYDNYSAAKFGMGINDLLKLENKNDYQNKITKNFSEYNVLLDNNYSVNQISHYMEKEIKILKITLKNSKINYNEIFGTDTFIVNENIYKKLKELYNEFNHYKKVNYSTKNIQNFYEIMAYFHRKAGKISNNLEELAKISLKINTKFAFQVFGQEIIEILLKRNYNHIRIPVKDLSGEIKYMGSNYSIVRFILGEIKCDIELSLMN
jgi:hypothetical protein